LTDADGRRARGAARRRQLVEATLAVIERDGVAGLSHRAVADEAGVSLASASYHFDGLDDLVTTALVHATDELVAALLEDPDRSLARLARLLAAEATEHRGRLVAGYELYLMALRQPLLRPQALTWLDVVSDAFAPELHGAERRAFQAVVEGICLHALMQDPPWRPDEIETMLRVVCRRG